MAIQLGDEAPDFTAQTTEGELSFHDWTVSYTHLTLPTIYSV